MQCGRSIRVICCEQARVHCCPNATPRYTADGKTVRREVERVTRGCVVQRSQNHRCPICGPDSSAFRSDNEYHTLAFHFLTECLRVLSGCRLTLPNPVCPSHKRIANCPPLSRRLLRFPRRFVVQDRNRMVIHKQTTNEDPNGCCE